MTTLTDDEKDLILSALQELLSENSWWRMWPDVSRLIRKLESDRDNDK